MLLEGSIHYYIKEFCYHMQAGDLLVVKNNHIHKAINLTNKPFRRLVIHIHPDFIEKISTQYTDLSQCFTFSEEGQDAITLSHYDIDKIYTSGLHLIKLLEKEDVTYGNDIFTNLKVIELLIEVNLCYIKRHGNIKIATPSRIHKIMDYINSNIEKELTLDLIGKEMSLDKYYISHIFKIETQSTIFQYIIVKRVSLAKELLQLGHTVTEACQRSGFNDYSNFIRTFKKITGQTPGQYKKAIYP